MLPNIKGIVLSPPFLIWLLPFSLFSTVFSPLGVWVWPFSFISSKFSLLGGGVWPFSFLSSIFSCFNANTWISYPPLKLSIYKLILLPLHRICMLSIPTLLLSGPHTSTPIITTRMQRAGPSRARRAFGLSNKPACCGKVGSKLSLDICMFCFFFSQS